MLKFIYSKSVAAVVIGVVFGGSYVVASGASGDFFHSDPPKHDSEDIRMVSIATSGGTGADSLDVAFTNLLPGAPQTVTVNFRNSGNVPESVWVAFPNSTALSALNTLGNYGSVHLSSGGAGALGTVFDTTNLSDNAHVCGAFTTSGCWPLQHQYLIATNLAPGGRGTFSFGFEFATAYSLQPLPGSGARWNHYPVAGQTNVLSSDGTGAGLPYQLIATQSGVIPGQPESIVQNDPFGDTVSTTKSASEFSDHLKVEGPEGPILYTVTNPNVHLNVSEDGGVTTVGGPLAVGVYAISGTDSANNGAVGNWTYTLTVVRRHRGHHIDD